MAFDNKLLQKILASAVQALGYDLWGFELGMGGKRLLIRVYIEAAKGVSVDDCALASRQINAMLEVDMADLRDYVLEVSSPGIDRPLFSLEQYAKYLGETIQVRTGQMYEGRRNFTGLLEAVTDDKHIVLNVDGQQYHLSFADIEKAKLLPKILINRKS